MRAAREASPELFATDGMLEESAIPEFLREAVEIACQAIFQAAQGDPALAGMGTTVTAVLVAGPKAFVAHVGDSRCYLARRGRIYQVTEDHSLVNEQLKAGAITPEEAKHSRFRNIITRSVGFESDVSVDLMGVDLEIGDRIVVCCDGLSNLVEDAGDPGGRLHGAPRRRAQGAHRSRERSRRRRQRDGGRRSRSVSVCRAGARGRLPAHRVGRSPRTGPRPLVTTHR